MAKQEKYIDVSIDCGSEKGNGSVYFGGLITEKEFKEGIATDPGAFAESISDYIDEFADEFEPGFSRARKLIEEGKQPGAREALFEVYGRFYIYSVSVDGVEQAIDCLFDPEEMIYDALEKVYAEYPRRGES